MLVEACISVTSSHVEIFQKVKHKYLHKYCFELFFTDNGELLKASLSSWSSCVITDVSDCVLHEEGL